MAMSDWMEKAAARMKAKGTKGKFSAKAKAAGMSTAEYAKEKAHAPGVLGKEARFAEIAERNK